MDERILAWFARERIPFLMEVADRTPADRKGGHLARRAGGGGGLVLREVAQTPDEDLDAFQDIDRHRFFNTNTLWLDLRALAATLGERRGVLGLPMIVNRKTVDPGDADSTAVLQLETAMGAAIDVFEGARAIRVPRTRFAPVKTTNDLLALRSDAYVLHGDGRIALAPERDGRGVPLVDLDPRYFKLLRDFDARFPAGAPSLVGCERLTVRGDVAFGAGVVVRGEVTVEQGDGGPRHRTARCWPEERPSMLRVWVPDRRCSGPRGPAANTGGIRKGPGGPTPRGGAQHATCRWTLPRGRIRRAGEGDRASCKTCLRRCPLRSATPLPVWACSPRSRPASCRS